MRGTAFGSQKWRKVDPPGDLGGRPTASVEWAALLFCFAAGLACLAFVLGPGDGTWLLYAREMKAGHRIYSDLALNQQPFFPLLSLVGLKLSPGGLLGDRLIFFAVLGLHVLLIFMISRRVAGSALVGMSLTLATYFTAIHFEAFRYDDYHAVAQCTVLASLYLSLRYAEGECNANWFALAQGALAAGAFLTRVNEGLAIVGAVAAVLLARHGASKMTARLALMSIMGASSVLALVLLLVSETPSTWFSQTLLVASQAKGGRALAAAPALALVHALEFLLVARALIFAVVLSLAAFVLFARRPKDDWGAALQGAGAAGCVFLALKMSYQRDPLIPLAAFALVLSSGGFLLWAIRWLAGALREAGQAGRTLALVSYPCFMFLTGALSTGGEVYGLYFPLALALVVGTLMLRKSLSDENRLAFRAALSLFLCLIGAEAFVYRVHNPFSWHSYHVNPLFTGYRVENDPRHGPHLITPELRDLILPVCARVGRGRSLLSLPLSFANYYCDVPVWHGYVQTFFDTSTKSRIEQLERELEQAPPDLILYQRQLELLRLHEKIFAGGRPLPHRELDELIVSKVRSGEWTVIYRSPAYPPSTWYLISTHKRRLPA